MNEINTLLTAVRRGLEEYDHCIKGTLEAPDKDNRDAAFILADQAVDFLNERVIEMGRLLLKQATELEELRRLDTAAVELDERARKVLLMHSGGEIFATGQYGEPILNNLRTARDTMTQTRAAIYEARRNRGERPNG